MILQAAINGARRPGEHPLLPLSPPDIAREARAAEAAGAAAVHAHVRDAQMRESLAAADVAAVLSTTRPFCPHLPIGVSTGAWIVPDPDERLACVAAWTILPDFASVNFHEAGAAGLARLLLERGVGVEAGVISEEAAARLAESGLAPRCLRILIEPQEQEPGEALGTVTRIESRLPRRGTAPILLHGVEAVAWWMLAEAARRGYDARIGLEDVLTLPDGSPAPDNTALIRAALAIIGPGRT